MNDFNDVFKSIAKAGEKIGESMDKKCPKCKGIMCLLKKYVSLNIYFWMCDCGISFPADIK